MVKKKHLHAIIYAVVVRKRQLYIRYLKFHMNKQFDKMLAIPDSVAHYGQDAIYIM